MHDRVHAREDLDQLVRLLDRDAPRPSRRASRSASARLRAPDGRPHLVAMRRAPRTIARPRSPDAPVTITVMSPRCYRRRSRQDIDSLGRVQPDAADIERVRRALGATPVAWRAAPGHGAPSNRRFVVDLRGGTVRIREDRRIRLHGGLAARGAPRLCGARRAAVPATVVRLGRRRARSRARPRGSLRIDVAATVGRRSHRRRPRDPRGGARCDPAPEGVPPAVESQFGLDGWPDVAADPQPFLSLGLCAPEWLFAHLPALVGCVGHRRDRGNVTSCTSTCAATTSVCGTAEPC